MSRGVLNVYHGPIESLECQHKVKIKNKEKDSFEWVSTWVKYWPERYAGRIEKCRLCKQKRVLDTTGQPGEKVGYIEQASLF
jgi:hypothetical protein